MGLDIQYTRLTATGARVPLGGTVLPVTTSATPGGSQPTTPSPDDTLLIDLRSDVWAAVDIAATPSPTGSASSILIVGPGSPQTIRGRKGLKIATIGTGAPGGATGADLTAIRATAADARDIAGQARSDVATLQQIVTPNNSDWTTP